MAEKLKDGTQVIPATADAFTQKHVIYFRPNLTWTSVLPVPAMQHDIIAVAMHELGHVLGLHNHSIERNAAMFFSVRNGLRRYEPDDIERLQARYGGRRELVPGHFGANAAGVDLAVFPGAAGTNLFVGHIDDKDGPNKGQYRVGWGLDIFGRPTKGFSQITDMGGPFGDSTVGLGIAVGNVTGGADPDLIVVWMDAPGGENHMRYRIGRDLDPSGLNGNWSGPDTEIPGWFGSETDGVGAALGDIDEDGKPELVIAWIDDANGENTIYLKIGRDFDANGIVQNWSVEIPVPGPIGYDSAGLGIALTDLRGNGRPDLVITWVDDRAGENTGFLKVGWDIDGTGTPIGGWSVKQELPGWWGANTQESGLAVAPIRGFDRPDLLVAELDDPDGDDFVHYRVLTPPLPAWQSSRPLAPRSATLAPGIVDHLTAVATLPNAPVTPDLDERADVVVVGVGIRAGGASDAPQEVLGVFWDKTDQYENKGSDVLDLEIDKVKNPSRRAASPLAIVARDETGVDLFWIDTTNRVSTVYAPVGMPGSTQAPTWNAPTSLNPGPVARSAVATPTATVPGSPLAAMSLDPDHMAVFVAGPTDQISGMHWTSKKWAPAASDLTGGWPKPVTAIAAIGRQHKFIEVFWVDVEGGIWAATTMRDGTWKPAERIFLPGTVRRDSPLVALTRADDQVDLFWIAPGGEVQSSFFHDMGPSNTQNGKGWSRPFGIDRGVLAVAGSGLAAVHQGDQRMHAFWVGDYGHDGPPAVTSAWWAPRADGIPVSWSPTTRVSDPGAVLSGSDLVAVARMPERLRVYFTDSTGYARYVWWGTLP